MKKLYVIFSLLICYFLQAQIVNIPDLTFKAKLLDASVNNITASFGIYPNLTNTTIDTNGDGEIQYSEAEVITYLYLVNSGINDLTGIEAFTNLTHLSCGTNNLTSVNITQLTNLISLNFYQNQLTSLDVSNLPNLSIVSCQFNQITTLNIINTPMLEKVFCNNNQLTSLDFSNNPLFNELDCMNNPNLTSINISNGTNQLLGPQTIYNQCWTGCPNLSRICADSSELLALENYLDSCNIDINTIDFSSHCALGNEEFIKKELVVYPNPTSSKVNVTSSNEIKNIAIIDVQGRIIFMQQVDKNNTNIDMSGYSKGVYFIKIATDKGIKTEKIIKE